ncbi:MAG: SLOG-associating effector domain family 5 [Pseudomonadota bacterium]|jgi:hypothetical protein
MLNASSREPRLANPERQDRHFARQRAVASARRQLPDFGIGRWQHTAAGVPDVDEKTRLLRKLAIVKRARFNAAKRLESKHDAGQLALAIAGIYGFLIPLFTLQFKGTLAPMTISIVDFVAVVAGALSFAIGFLYQERNYKSRAHAFHDCALEINRLRHELAATHVSYEHEIRGYIARYNDIMERYANHDEIDYRLALAERRRTPEGAATGGRTHAVRLWSLRIERFLRTHGLNLAVWLVPPVVGLSLWATLPRV